MMKKVLAFFILIVLTATLLCACTTTNKRNKPNRNNLNNQLKNNYVKVEFFNGSTNSTLNKKKGTSIDLTLSEIAYQHISQFRGWRIAGGEYETEDDVFTYKITAAVEIEPIFDIKFSQSIPEDLDYFNSSLNIAKYNEFASISSPSFVYPGLSKEDKAVIQGITYVEKYNLVLISAYIFGSNSWSVENSVVFVIDMNETDSNGFKGKLTKTILLHNIDGSSFTGHAGGITATEKSIFITDSKSILRLPLDTVLIPNKLIFAKFEEEIKVPVSASYCFFADNVLWVGEFAYEKENYHTAQSHKSTYNGVQYTAWTVGYQLDESENLNHNPDNGFKISALKGVAIPDYVLIHGDRIQGFATINSKIVLSESYGRANDSHWFIHDASDFANHTENENYTTVKVAGSEVPAFYLTNSKTLLAPPMSEDLTVYKENGKEYLLFASEAACYKYLQGVWLGSSKNPSSVCWKIDLSLLD